MLDSFVLRWFDHVPVVIFASILLGIAMEKKLTTTTSDTPPVMPISETNTIANMPRPAPVVSANTTHGMPAAIAAAVAMPSKPIDLVGSKSTIVPISRFFSFLSAERMPSDSGARTGKVRLQVSYGICRFRPGCLWYRCPPRFDKYA